jgi:polygalacturonase
LTTITVGCSVSDAESQYDETTIWQGITMLKTDKMQQIDTKSVSLAFTKPVLALLFAAVAAGCGGSGGGDSSSTSADNSSTPTPAPTSTPAPAPAPAPASSTTAAGAKLTASVSFPAGFIKASKDFGATADVMRSVKEYGAVGDGVTDDTAAIKPPLPTDAASAATTTV